MSDDHRSFHILLVEDNPGDVGLIRRALAAGKLRTHLHVAHDGLEALDFLTHDAGDSGAQRPDLILMDLSLPKLDGCEVLWQIKQDPLLLTIPVIILSSSQAEQDVLRSYAHYANCYVTKPLDLEQYMALIGSVQQFWLTIAKLPRNGNHG